MIKKTIITLLLTILFTSHSYLVKAANIDEGIAGINTVLDKIDPIEIKSALEDSYMFTTTKVNLRKDSSIDSEILITLDKRVKVEILKKTSSDWIKVKYKDYIGYIYSDYLRNTELPCLNFTDKEIDLLAKIVWLESRGEPDEGSAGVVIVVINRILSEDFSDEMFDVLSDKGQFSSWKLLNTADPQEREFEIIDEVLHGEYDGLLTDDTVYFSTEPRNKNITAHIGNHYFCGEDN